MLLHRCTAFRQRYRVQHVQTTKIAEYMATVLEPEFPVTVTEVHDRLIPVIEAIGFIEPNQGNTG